MATIDEIFKVQKTTKGKKAKKSTAVKRKSAANDASTTSAGQSDVNEAVDEDFEKLRQFDLDTTFGPCTGMTRLERWKRAEKFNFSPPQEILELMEQHPEDKKYTHCVWHDMKI